jgi:Bacterial Ig-like domain
MTSRLILLTLAAALTLVACPTTTPVPTPSPPQTGPPEPPTPPPTETPPPPPTQPSTPPEPPTPPAADVTGPTVVSVSPDNAANGVEANAKIRIAFSEPMNRRATEQAYQSTDMPSVTFTWSANDTKLEIDPAGDLEHTPTGRLYNFTIRETAKDLAGNALARLTSRFRTLRELTQTLESVAALDGHIMGTGFVNETDDYIEVGDSLTNNAQYKGFLSFDLTALKTDGLTISQRITEAKVRVFQTGAPGSPFTNLQVGGRQLLAAHIVYGSALNTNDFNSTILHDLGEISSNATIEYKVAPNALESVRDDWTERVGRGNRSQFMLFFPLATDGDGQRDTVIFSSREVQSNPPELEVTFLVP